jgi:precorrin-6B methylase 2
MSLTTPPKTDPTAIYAARDCLYADDMLTAALVGLDLFTWVGQQPGGVDCTQVCMDLGLKKRPVDVLLTLLAARGFLVLEDSRFVLTEPAREHLVSDSPWFIGPYYASLKDRPIVRDILEVLRTDKPANWSSNTQLKDWHQSMETEAFAKQFTAAMDCRGVYLAQAAAKAVDLSAHHHLLDIAGGSGIYACSFAAHHPHLNATVLEKPPVDRIAAQNIADRGFSGQVAVVASDMLDAPLPAEPDVHLFSNVLHDWDVPIVQKLLVASHQSLPAGGMLIIHDAFLNEDNTGPLHVAEYSVMLMHSTQGRCYGTGEMRKWLEAAGFGEVCYQDTAAARGIMTAVRL